MKVETRQHFITSSRTKKPTRACTGLCLAVWWDDDLDTNVLQVYVYCPGCGGKTVAAIEGEHYTILEHISFHQGDGLKVGRLSQVKPEFVELAKRTWCA